MTSLIAVVGLVLVASAPPVAADQSNYTGHNECFQVRPCPIGDKAQGPIICGVGVVCYAGNHITPDSNGKATVSVTDDLIRPATGFACQDLDSDNFCGEVGSELSEPFCGSTTLGNGDHWDPGAELFVFIGGPATAQQYCGHFGPGTHGYVSHS